VTLEKVAERRRAVATCAALEQLPDDRSCLGIGFKAPILALTLANRRAVRNGDAPSDGLFFRPLEPGPLALAFELRERVRRVRRASSSSRSSRSPCSESRLNRSTSAATIPPD
jgi:hypothetical protein